jgi:thiol-disulfide isomerase/thioredoxin
MAPTRRRVTRKLEKGKVLNVRSHAAVKSFEKILSKGPLTLVYVNAKWCGACHKFNDEVWSHLTQLKNKSVNLASVDSEMIGKTSLASVPRKFYPTLMLVGKDKKPATFEDEEGNPTNAMPRNSSLSEDREALSNMVTTNNIESQLTLSGSSNKPTSQLTLSGSSNKPTSQLTLSGSSNKPTSQLTLSGSSNKPTSQLTLSESSMQSEPLTDNQTKSSLNALVSRNSPRRANITMKSLAKSPFEALNSRTVTTLNLNSKEKTQSKKIETSNPPNIAADLVSSQTKSTPAASLFPEPVKGGSMLKSIREETARLKTMLRLRKNNS